jgi:universal stress protein E
MIMMPSDTIVVIVDAQARHHAGLAKAALLAEKYRTRMDLLTRGGGGLETLARPLRERGLEVTTAIIVAETLNAALARRLRGQCARFVIKDVDRAASSQRIALTHEDSELVRACPVPLLLSKSTLWPELPKICAAIDPARDGEGLEPADESAVAQGALLALHLAGQFRVVSTRSVCEVVNGFLSPLAASVIVMSTASCAVLCNTSEGLLPCDVLVVKAPTSLH